MHDLAYFLRAPARGGETSRPFDRRIAVGQFENDETAEHRLALGKVAQADAAVGVDNGRLLAVQTAAGHVNAGALGFAQHAVGGLADGLEFTVGNVHGAVVERHQIPRHVAKLLARLTSAHGCDVADDIPLVRHSGT